MINFNNVYDMLHEAYKVMIVLSLDKMQWKIFSEEKEGLG